MDPLGLLWITLIHRQETLSFLGIPLTRHIDLDDSEGCCGRSGPPRPATRSRSSCTPRAGMVLPPPRSPRPWRTTGGP